MHAGGIVCLGGDAPGLIAEVSEYLASDTRAARAWFTVDEASRTADDDEACSLLLDRFVAFDGWPCYGHRSWLWT